VLKKTFWSHYNAISVVELETVNESIRLCSLCKSCSRCFVAFVYCSTFFLIFICCHSTEKKMNI